MCGILAAFQDDAPISQQRLAAALRTIGHRGPDRSALWSSADGRIALGHARLSIIGVDNGDQPLATAAGDIHCVVNGEFYGYRAIRDLLRADGARFATDSDSEIALHLYERLGVECVHELRGEFAVVIADERRRRMIGIRDRFGIKPLFYAVRGRDVFFASEVKALVALGVTPRWDGEAFFADCHQARSPHRTLFAGIFAVPPGCIAIARDGRVDVRPYWDMTYPPREVLDADRRSDDEIVDGFRAVFDEAIAQRLVADVEVAVYLSGGIDSSAVLGLAQRKLSRPLRAFTVTFDDEMYNERGLAQRTAELAGANFVPVPVNQRQLADAFSDALWHAETLAMNGHGVAKYLLSQAVRDAGIKVVLTGEGADEMLAGYPPFRRDMILHNAERQDPTEAARLLAELTAANQASRGLLSAAGGTAPGLDTFTQRLGWTPSSFEAFSTLAAKIHPLFNDGYRAAQVGAGAYADLLDTIDVRGRMKGRDPVNQALYLWGRSNLPNYVLTYLGDRMEMAHSVEGRVPFLDHHVAEYAAKIPVHHKIRGMREKHVLREAVRDCVLPEIYDRQKHPFMSPPARTAGDALAEFCQDVLHSAAVQAQPFFEPQRVRDLMQRVADLPPQDRPAFEGAVLLVVSTCVLQERFAMSS
ncbi:MAG: asparagine synthase (glutamine-hydrolyzing) [Steroidobacteraceae bacterium]